MFIWFSCRNGIKLTVEVDDVAPREADGATAAACTFWIIEASAKVWEDDKTRESCKVVWPVHLLLDVLDVHLLLDNAPLLALPSPVSCLLPFPALPPSQSFHPQQIPKHCWNKMTVQNVSRIEIVARNTPIWIFLPRKQIFTSALPSPPDSAQHHPLCQGRRLDGQPVRGAQTASLKSLPPSLESHYLCPCDWQCSGGGRPGEAAVRQHCRQGQQSARQSGRTHLCSLNRAMAAPTRIAQHDCGSQTMPASNHCDCLHHCSC